MLVKMTVSTSNNPISNLVQPYLNLIYRNIMSNTQLLLWIHVKIHLNVKQNKTKIKYNSQVYRVYLVKKKYCYNFKTISK